MGATEAVVSPPGSVGIVPTDFLHRLPSQNWPGGHSVRPCDGTDGCVGTGIRKGSSIGIRSPGGSGGWGGRGVTACSNPAVAVMNPLEKGELSVGVGGLNGGGGGAGGGGAGGGSP